MNKVEEIKKLKALLDQGAITPEEYNELKKNVLSSVSETNDPQDLIQSTIQKDTFINEKVSVIASNEEIVQKKKKAKTSDSKEENGDIIEESYIKLEITKQEALKMLNKTDAGFDQHQLIYYSEVGNYKKTELMLIAGLDPNEFWYNPEQKRNIFPLHNSAGWGTTKMVKLLLSYGAEINLEDNNGLTAIFYAIQHGTKAIVKVLIEHGANVNHKSHNKTNPLYYAKRFKKPEIVDLLLKAGAEEMHADEIKTIDEGGNDTTVWLLKIGLILSFITGATFWYRYDSFFAFIIVLILGAGVSLAIPKVALKLLHKNLLLGLVSFIMLMLLIIPIGNTTNSSSGSSSNSSNQGSEIDRSRMNYCSKHSQWYYKDGSCPKCTDESIKKSTEKAREKFNHL